MRETSYLVLDIETIPDLEVYTPPEVPMGEERPFALPYAHRPIVIGLLWLDGDFAFKRLGVVARDEDEAAMLADFSQFVDLNRPNIVTWNGRSFDLPVIALRCLRHGVPLRWYYQGRGYRYRYSAEGHLDLCDVFSEHGAARHLKLNAVAKLVGLPGKIGVDGSQVEGLYRSGQIERIRNYCLSDVVQTAFVFLRYRLLSGACTEDDYRRVATALLEKLATDARLGDIMPGIDRKRLLIAP
jgi:3'-5' exonuclease